MLRATYLQAADSRKRGFVVIAIATAIDIATAMTIAIAAEISPQSTRCRARYTTTGRPVAPGDHARPFFALLAVGAVFNLANLVVWRTGLVITPTAWGGVDSGSDIPLSHVYLSLFLFFWNCAWLYLVATLVRHQGIGVANWIALIVLLGFVGAYFEQFREFNLDADFIIADVTDCNTNAFYELGMAHAVGKPVVILSQREADVPIDLKTRRWIPYDLEQSEGLVTALRKSIATVVEMYGLSTAAGKKS